MTVILKCKNKPFSQYEELWKRKADIDQLVKGPRGSTRPKNDPRGLLDGQYFRFGVKEALKAVSSSSGAQTVGITDRTMIWLDRSEQKQPNQNGGINDLQKGRKIEIKARKGEVKAVAEWIKVQVGP